MKNVIFMITVFFVLVSFANGQEQKKQKVPDEQIKVNKKYDENGNLIQYDSTYVHQWSSDSTFQFGFPDNEFFSGKGFPDMDKFLHEFMNDSVLGGMNIPGFFHYSPQEDDEFFMPFQHNSPDSLMQNFSFKSDSAFNDFQPDSLGIFPNGFDLRGLNDLHKKLEEQFGQVPYQNFELPEFKNKEQKEEWDNLMKKHQKEIEELRKKWERNR